MSLFLDGLGAIAKKATEWIPSKKESRETQIERLIDENSKLAQEEPLSVKTAECITNNLSRIKQLRKDLVKIN